MSAYTNTHVAPKLPHISYVITLEGLVIPMEKITSMSEKQFKDEEGVLAELRNPTTTYSDIIYIKYKDASHSVKVTDEWFKTILGHGSYDMYYNKYVIFNSWSTIIGDRNENNNS